MSLRINHNIEAMDTLRNLQSASNSFALSMQRLSSGKRINSAADDAAGYAISQKLQAQQNGLDQAQSNAQDGISMVQTANGGLQTIQNMLQRFRQLAVQSANDTNTTSDRQALQSEANQISLEITQIATTTQFNTKNLLDGSLGSAVTAAAGSSITGFNAGLTAGTATLTGGSLAQGAYTLAVTSTGVYGQTTAAGTAVGTPAATSYLGDTANGFKTDTTAGKDLANATGGGPGNYTLNITGYKGTSSVTINVGTSATTGDTYQNVIDKINALTSSTGVTAAWSANGLTFTNGQAGSKSGVTVTGSDILMKGLGIVAAGAAAASTTTNDTVTQNGTDGTATLTPASGTGGSAITLQGNGNKFTDTNSGFTVDLSGLTTSSTNATSLNGTATLSVTGQGAVMQVGANANQNLSVSVGDMRALALGIQVSATNTNAIDITTQANANAAITTIDTAIQTVSSQAASLGAVQNRLTDAINNLSIGAENMSAAYSQITDVNMAQESTNLATAQILQQSSTAMLAQANQAPQGVLKLLG